jgi:predicted amidohydrolase
MRSTILFVPLTFRFVRAMSSGPSKRAAVAQLTSTSNKLANLLHVAHCAGLAKRQGACMLFLPECFGFIGSSGTETLANAEILEDKNQQNDHIITSLLESTVRTDALPTSPEQVDNASISLMHGLRIIAEASNLWISGGGIHEYIDGERVYNTHVILNDKGELIHKYRKMHLFDVSIPDRGIELKESNTTKAGTSIEVCDSPLGVLGLTTCYDVRFPEQYAELVKLGAQIMLVPSAFTVPTGSAHWHILLRARAIESQCHVLAAAQVGRHNGKRESYGHALAVNPWGDIVADAALESPTIIICEIDLEQMADIRLRMPIQQHREAAQQQEL